MQTNSRDLCQYLPVLREIRATWTAEQWCPMFAQDREHQSCAVLDPDATYFCVQGALARALNMPGLLFFTHPLKHVLDTQAGQDIAWVNNVDGHGAVVQVLDACIAALKQQCIPWMDIPAPIREEVVVSCVA